MLFRSLALATLIVTSPAFGQKTAENASAAARPNGPAAAPQAKPDDAAVAAAEADVPPPTPGKFTLDTPIADLIADPSAKAVLDRDLPGLSDDENLDKFKSMSLRQFQPVTGGQLTDTMLAKVGTDLGDPNASKPTTASAPKAKKRQESGR